MADFDISASLAPWLASDPWNPSTYGGPGAMGAAMLAGAGPTPFRVPFGVALGKAMQSGQQNALAQAAARQTLVKGGVEAQQDAMMLPMLKAYYAAATGAAQGGTTPASQQGPTAPWMAGDDQQAPPQGSSEATPAPPRLLARPDDNSAPEASSVPAQVPWWTTPPTANDIASLAVGGMPPQMLTLGGLISHKSPVETAAAIRTQQLALAQQRAAPVLAQLDTLTKTANPTQFVAADPQLKAAWQQTAPGLGFDPVRDFTDANVRTAFAFARNRLAGSVSEASEAPIVPNILTRGPLGSILSRSPVTNDLKVVKPEEDLKPVVSKDGTVSYAPASTAAGATPFNDQTYVNPQTVGPVAKMIANYEMAPLSGYALRSAQGQAIMAAVKDINPQYDATAYATKDAARTRFATGKQGDIVRSLSVATNHLDQLSDAAKALTQSNFPALNRAANALGVQVGQDPVTTFNAMKEIVGDEVVKAVVGSTGAESDREAIKEAFDAARSPAQLKGVITHYEGLMGGQLSGLRRQYERSTGLHDFGDFVSSLAQEKLGAADTHTGPARIASDADYSALPSGATFVAPDGTTRRKP